MIRRETTVKVVVGVLLVLVLILASTALYYNFALASTTANVESLQSAMELQKKDIALLAVTQPAANLSIVGLDPAGIYNSVNRSVVTIQGSRIVTALTLFGPQRALESILGSGFVVKYSNAYYVVTNFHVVDSLVNVTVTFWNGDSFPAKVVGSDPNSDIAILSSNASTTDLYPLYFGSSSSMRVGQPVVAIGDPFGLSGSVTFGIISQVGRTVQYQSTTGAFAIADAIQFSAPINPGNSGGPLLNAYGTVIGITSAAVTGSQGVGFAIPSDSVVRELPFLIETGKYSMHPNVGIEAADMNYQLAQAMKTNITYGVLIENTTPHGPADNAGLRGGKQVVTIGSQQYVIGGDIISSVNGTRIVNYDAFAAYLEENTTPGDTVRLGIIRSGSYMAVQVVIGSLPS